MTIIGIDYGRKRLGAALSDAGHRIATPLTVIERKDASSDIDAVRKIAEEHSATIVVVGLPVRTDGKPSEMAAEAKAFAARLGEKTGLKIEFWDERLSTAQAERAMIEADMSRRHRQQRIDKVAAQMILQSYLDSRRAK